MVGNPGIEISSAGTFYDVCCSTTALPTCGPAFRYVFCSSGDIQGVGFSVGTTSQKLRCKLRLQKLWLHLTHQEYLGLVLDMSQCSFLEITSDSTVSSLNSSIQKLSDSLPLHDSIGTNSCLFQCSPFCPISPQISATQQPVIVR